MTDTIDALDPALDHPTTFAPPSDSPFPPPSPAAPPALASPGLPVPGLPGQSAPPPPQEAPPADPEPSPAMITGPSAMFSADAALLPPEHMAPSLPTLAPVTPQPTAQPAPGAAFDMGEFLDDRTPQRKGQTKKKSGSGAKRLLLVALLGAGGWAAYTYGPGLYEEYVSSEDATFPNEADEVDAPLAFPNVTAVSTPIRTAEFVLEGLPETPGVTYRVTTDFDTDVSQVDITREGSPALQVLTYGDDAMIQRVGGDEWYLLDRGQFPLDGRLDRADWVRGLDELLPPAMRSQVSIDDSGDTTISGVATRHLTLTVDRSLFASIAPPTTVVDPAAPPLDLGAAPPAEPSAADPAPARATDSILLDVWIDGDGLVRQVSGAPELGAQTITVVRTSADPWIPAYPMPERIFPLTAQALVDLGL